MTGGFLVHTAKLRVAVRAYCGMWIADCEFCKSAEQLNRFQPAVMCSYCEALIELVWPAHDMVYSIERLLLMRPLEYNRNWFPHETLHDLMRENAEHGVFDVLKPFADASGPSVSLLGVNDFTIKTDRLPVTQQRELKAIGD